MPNHSVPGYPPGAKELFDELWQQICAISAKWQLCKRLFMQKEDREVLKKTASGAFWLIEQSIRNDIVMGVGRLMDPAKTGKNHNISISQLIANIQDDCTHDLREQISKDYDIIKMTVDPFLKIRNKKVGHTDMATALSPTPDPEMAISVPIVDETLMMIYELMNNISMYFTDTHHMFEEVVMDGDGEHLLLYLKAALEHFELHKQQEYERFGLPYDSLQETPPDMNNPHM